MASSKEEWQNYQNALKRGDQATPAEALKRYLKAKRLEMIYNTTDSRQAL